MPLDFLARLRRTDLGPAIEAFVGVGEMANGTKGWCMAKAKKAKPRDRLVRWRVSLIKGSAWHGRGPPRRYARRVVAAASDARPCLGLIDIRTKSLPLAVSVSGKRNSWAREKCAEAALKRSDAVSVKRSDAQIPANSAPFVYFREISAIRGLPGGECSRCRTGLHHVFHC
jgi:hypothetical protein